MNRSVGLIVIMGGACVLIIGLLIYSGALLCFGKNALPIHANFHARSLHESWSVPAPLPPRDFPKHRRHRSMPRRFDAALHRTPASPESQPGLPNVLASRSLAREESPRKRTDPMAARRRQVPPRKPWDPGLEPR